MRERGEKIIYVNVYVCIFTYVTYMYTYIHKYIIHFAGKKRFIFQFKV